MKQLSEIKIQKWRIEECISLSGLPYTQTNYSRDDLIKRRNYAEKKNLIIRISSHWRAILAMECRVLTAEREDWNPLVNLWWESGPGQWWDSLWGALPGTCWSGGPLLHRGCVSFHPSSQLSSPSSFSSSPCQSLVYHLLLFRSRHWTIARIILRTPLWSFGTITSHPTALEVLRVARTMISQCVDSFTVFPLK